MPYASYRDLTAEDVDAMYAYLTTREAIARANVPDDLHFPMNFRALVVRGTSSAAGAGAARCGEVRRNHASLPHQCAWSSRECYIRNFMMAMERDRYLKGAVIEAVEAPDITRDALAMVGLSPRVSRASCASGSRRLER